jgi:hypothetical protein
VDIFIQTFLRIHFYTHHLLFDRANGIPVRIYQIVKHHTVYILPSSFILVKCFQFSFIINVYSCFYLKIAADTFLSPRDKKNCHICYLFNAWSNSKSVTYHALCSVRGLCIEACTRTFLFNFTDFQKSIFSWEHSQTSKTSYFDKCSMEMSMKYCWNDIEPRNCSTEKRL